MGVFGYLWTPLPCKYGGYKLTAVTPEQGQKWGLRALQTSLA